MCLDSLYVSVGFYTGPNLMEYDYEIKCVDETSSCDAPGQGVGVTGTLPRAPGYVTGTVTDLLFNTTYWCYALSSARKVSKCQGPLIGVTTLPQGALVRYGLGYRVPPSFFTLEKQEQVCKNLLALSLNGTCVVETVNAGAARAINSSEVSGSVEYNSYLSGQRLFEDLSDPTNSTLSTLATDIVNSTADVSVLRVSFEFVQKTDVPGPPGFVMAPVYEQTNATITWLDGKTGTPEETYTVNCVASSGNTPLCTDSGVNVTGIARGVQTANLDGLSPNTTYSCWAIAVNPSASVCSVEPVMLRTLIPAGLPSNLQEASISNETVTIDWTDGLEGNPVETYTVKCVQGTGTSCTSSGAETTGLSRGSQQGTVYGLTPNTTYECWVIAENQVGSVCSASPLQITTWIEAGQPDCPLESSITNTTVTIDWQDGLQGNPEETYTVNCVQSPSTSCTSLELYTANIVRGTLSGTVGGFTPNTTYYCYVLAVNQVATVCSVSVPITTYVEPGAPTNPQNPSISTTWALVSWDDGALGRPQETYSVNCVLGSGSTTCRDSGVSASGIARGVQSANVTGLSANTTYSCWPIAGNVIGSVCSSTPVINTTWIQAGAPTSLVSGTIGSTSVPFSWQDGAAGNPVESYTIVCSTATSASDCVSPGGTVKEQPGIPRGVESGTVSGLSGSTAYKCWVKAVNPVGETCSSGQLVTTAPSLLGAQVVTYDQSVSITPSAYTPPGGATNLTYQAQCLDASATVCNPQASGTGALQPSPGSSSPVPLSVSGLTNDVLYQCFAVVSYTLNSETKYVCSGPVQAKPFTAPGALPPQSVVSGDQKLIITPSTFTAPSGAANIAYQVQCLGASATLCDPLASGTGALQPSTAQSNPSAITVPGLTNNALYQCFSVVTYTLNAMTQYTCSPAFAAIPALPPTLSTAGVIAGTQRIIITPDSYSLPAGTSNITYQVQCFQSLTSVCNPNYGLLPSPGLSSLGPIEVGSLNDRSLYSCFSVVSYMLNSSQRYTCSDVFQALSYTQPVDLTAQGVVSQDQKMTVYVAAYTNLPAQQNVEYQVQCLDSSATVCNPAATGSGAVQPSTAQSYAGFKIVPGLTTNTTYQCFSVISYTYSSALKYTCSNPFQVISAPEPTLTTQKVLASSGKISITPDAYTGPSGASNIGYQVQCFGSSSVVCDLVNTAATPSTPLTSPGAIPVTGLSNNQIQYCFSVVSYDVNGTTSYTCSAAFEAVPFTNPSTLTSSNVVSGNQTLTITPTSYSPPSSTSNVQYQVQCLDSSATVCNPLATGTGALQPTTAQSSLSPIVVSSLTNGVTYKCFTVVTYLLNSNTKYTCSAAGYAAIPVIPPNFAYPYGVAITGSSIFVTNSNDNSVTGCTIAGTSVTGCARTGTGLNGPLGIGIIGSTAYIVNAGSNAVSQCSISGTSFGSCSAMTTSPSYSFNIPRGITISGSTAFISSGPTGGTQIVTACTISGSSLVACAVTGSNFNGPRTTAITGSTAFVTNYETNTNSVTSCTVNTGVNPNTLGSCGANAVNIRRATGIAIDGSTAFVTDAFYGKVQACTISSGTSPPSLTTCTDARLGFNLPNEIAIDNTYAYIANGGNNTLIACGISGTSLNGCVQYA